MNYIHIPKLLNESRQISLNLKTVNQIFFNIPLDCVRNINDFVNIKYELHDVPMQDIVKKQNELNLSNKYLDYTSILIVYLTWIIDVTRFTIVEF